MKTKKMFHAIAALCLIALTSNALAVEGKQVDYSGKNQVFLNYFDTGADNYGYRNVGVNVKSEALVKTWGEGKIVVSLNVDTVKTCQGFHKSYIGYESAYELYNLYELSGEQMDVDPSTAKPAARLSIEEHGAHLNFLNEMKASTSDKKGNICSWIVGVDVALGFKTN